jgi:hypothetical protein
MSIVTLAAAPRNAALNAITALINTGGAGTINFYTGAMPATPDTATTTQVLLATLTFSATAFGAATTSGSVSNAVAGSITPEDAALDTGIITWARIRNGSGAAIMDVDVGVTGSAATVTLNTTSIIAGGEVILTSATLTMGA